MKTETKSAMSSNDEEICLFSFSLISIIKVVVEDFVFMYLNHLMRESMRKKVKEN